MTDANLIVLGKASLSSTQNKRGKKSDARLQLRDEIDKLALFVREMKAQADRVQKAADALGDELLLDGSACSDGGQVNPKDGRFLR